MRNTVASLFLMVLAISSIIQICFYNQPAYGQSSTDWNGTWRGSWGGQVDTSVTIFDGKVARYEYRGQPIPVTVFKIEGSMITFGVPGKYAVRILRTGSNTATANYKNLHNDDTAVADLERY